MNAIQDSTNRGRVNNVESRGSKSLRCSLLAVVGLTQMLLMVNGVGAQEPVVPSAATDPAEKSSTTLVVARAELEGGHILEFVDEGDSIGIAEKAPAGSKSNLETIVARDNASPLEVFRAVAPGRDAPERLVADHKAFVRSAGRVDPAPRSLHLTTVLPTLASVDEGYDTSLCTFNESYTPGSSQFTNWWFWIIGAGKDFTAQQTYQFSDLNGTAGKAWYAGKTRQRWLGACNGNYVYGFPAFQFRAEFRNYTGQWVAAYTTQLEPYHWIKYYSFSAPQRWRVRLRELGFDVFLSRTYGVAVAGDKPFGFVLKQ